MGPGVNWGGGGLHAMGSILGPPEMGGGGSLGTMITLHYSKRHNFCTAGIRRGAKEPSWYDTGYARQISQQKIVRFGGPNVLVSIQF